MRSPLRAALGGRRVDVRRVEGVEALDDPRGVVGEPPHEQHVRRGFLEALQLSAVVAREELELLDADDAQAAALGCALEQVAGAREGGAVVDDARLAIAAILRRVAGEGVERHLVGQKHLEDRPVGPVGVQRAVGPQVGEHTDHRDVVALDLRLRLLDAHRRAPEDPDHVGIGDELVVRDFPSRRRTSLRERSRSRTRPCVPFMSPALRMCCSDAVSDRSTISPRNCPIPEVGTITPTFKTFGSRPENSSATPPSSRARGPTPPGPHAPSNAIPARLLLPAHVRNVRRSTDRAIASSARTRPAGLLARRDRMTLRSATPGHNDPGSAQAMLP